MANLIEQIKGRWREFRREPSAFFFVILMPILWMAILGSAFSNDAATVFGVGWQASFGDQSTDLVRAVRHALEKDPRVKFASGTTAELAPRLKRGEIQVSIATHTDGDGFQIAHDPTSRDALIARSIVNDIIQVAAGRRDVVPTTTVEVRAEGARYIDFLVPGLLALSLMTSSLFGTGMTIVTNRRENLLKRYLATPMRPLTYIVSHIIGRGFVLAVELVTILAAGFLMFRFKVEGNLVHLVLFSALGAASFTALALLCAARTSNAAFMNGMTNLISLPMMIVAGIWFSRTNFPDWIQTLARYLPLSALVDGLRKIALEGLSLADLGPEVAALAAVLLVSTVGAKALFKWY